MKKILFIILILSSFVASSQGKFAFEGVIEIEENTKNSLFIKARKWFSNSFKDMKSVLDVQDAENGELFGKFTIPYYSKIKRGRDCSQGYIEAQISVMVKDNKYKYEIYGFRHISTPNLKNCMLGGFNFGHLTTDSIPPFRIKGGWGRKWEIKVWNEIKEHATIYAKVIEMSLIQEMSNKEKSW